MTDDYFYHDDIILKKDMHFNYHCHKALNERDPYKHAEPLNVS